MDKYEIAKELTLAAINSKFISEGTKSVGDFLLENEQLAENVAAFYNKLVEKLKTT